jgi:hypothetical protein
VEEIVRDHDFIDGICRWCGGHSSEFLTQLLTCVPRWVETRPRPTPISIFNDPASIGERMREIQAGEIASAHAEDIPDEPD